MDGSQSGRYALEKRQQSISFLDQIDCDKANSKDEISGYLHKRRGGFGKHMPNAWQPRYFIVRDGWMYYFEEKKLNARPRGKIDLQSELVTLVVNLHFENSPSPHTLLINPGGYEEKWKLCAANNEDMEQWCDVINGHINVKHKRKPAQLPIAEYDSDNEVEDVHETLEDDNVVAVTPTTSPKRKNGKTVTYASDFEKGSAPNSIATATPHSAKIAKEKNKTTAKIRSNDNISDKWETILTVGITNLCVVFAAVAEKVVMRVVYFVLANVVVLHTLYLRTNRVDKQSKEMKVLATAKERADATVAKQASRLTVLEEALAETAHLSSQQVTPLREEIESKATGSELKSPGTTIKQVFGTPSNEAAHTWCRCDATTFNVRQGPNYNKFKKKTPSGDAFYEPFAMDTFCARKKIDHIAKFLALPSVAGINTNNAYVPPIFIIQMQMPTDPPPLFGSVEDGPGWAVVLYFRITDATCQALKDLSTASPALKLFAKYCQFAETDFAWRSRLKLIGCCNNLDELGVPGVIASYNAKPVMIKKTGSIFRGDSYLEVNINIHKWPSYVKQCIQFMYTQSALMYLQVGFVVEGREDDELPETLFACAGVNRPIEDEAEFFFEEDAIDDEQA